MGRDNSILTGPMSKLLVNEHSGKLPKALANKAGICIITKTRAHTNHSDRPDAFLSWDFTTGRAQAKLIRLMAEWDNLKAAALKILGKDGEVPDMPDNIQKSADALGKANGEFNKSREDCEAKLLAVEN